MFKPCLAKCGQFHQTCVARVRLSFVVARPLNEGFSFKHHYEEYYVLPYV